MPGHRDQSEEAEAEESPRDDESCYSEGCRGEVMCGQDPRREHVDDVPGQRNGKADQKHYWLPSVERWDREDGADEQPHGGCHQDVAVGGMDPEPGTEGPAHRGVRAARVQPGGSAHEVVMAVGPHQGEGDQWHDAQRDQVPARQPGAAPRVVERHHQPGYRHGDDGQVL